MIRIDLLEPSSFETYVLLLDEGHDGGYTLRNRSGTAIDLRSFAINISDNLEQCVLRTSQGVINARIIRKSTEPDDARDSGALPDQNEPGNS